MKFKERLWQLFLVIVLGVTLSVCDAGDSDDDFDDNLLSAGNAIASDDSSSTSSTSITSGDNYVQWGNFMMVSGSATVPADGSAVNLGQSFNNNFVKIIVLCSSDNTVRERAKTINASIQGSDYCSPNYTINYIILGKYK